MAAALPFLIRRRFPRRVGVAEDAEADDRLGVVQTQSATVILDAPREAAVALHLRLGVHVTRIARRRESLDEQIDALQPRGAGRRQRLQLLVQELVLPAPVDG